MVASARRRIWKRLSQFDVEIDWVGSNHFLWDIVTDEGRQCDGDSGGPTVATNVASYDVAMGVVSNKQVSGSNACGSPGHKDRHTLLSDNVAWIESKMGSCATFTGVPGFLYKQCW